MTAKNCFQSLISPGAALPASAKVAFNIDTAFSANPVFVRLNYRQIKLQQLLRSRKVHFIQDKELGNDLHKRYFTHNG